MLTGSVTEERLLNATTGAKFDCVHFVAHATDAGVDMVSWTMAPKQVAQLCNHVRAGFVFLNVCRSVFLPQFLIDQHIPAVLSHTLAAGVADKEALQLAAYFYEELGRQGDNFHRAYEIISPRDGTLAWSSNGAYLGALEPLARQVQSLEMKVANQRLNWLICVVGVDTFLVVVELVMLLMRKA